MHPSSPAEKACLRPYTDYVIGADSVLHESEDLFSLIENHEGRPLKLYVYNIDEDSCREVIVEPNTKWGGVGSLGCGIGYGYLHRIPVQEIESGKEIRPTTENVTEAPQQVFLQSVPQQVMPEREPLLAPPPRDVAPQEQTSIIEMGNNGGTENDFIVKTPLYPETIAPSVITQQVIFFLHFLVFKINSQFISA